MDAAETGPPPPPTSTTPQLHQDGRRCQKGRVPQVKVPGGHPQGEGQGQEGQGQGESRDRSQHREAPGTGSKLDEETYDLLKKANEGRDEMLIPNWNRIKNEKVNETERKLKPLTNQRKNPNCDTKNVVPKNHNLITRNVFFQMHAPATWEETPEEGAAPPH